MVTQFYIVEVQQNPQGEYGHLVHWAYDEDPDLAQRKAESKYYEVLTAAAISNTITHSAILFSTEGFPLQHKCYHNIKNVQPTPEPEPESEPEEESEPGSE